jgi:hypothetical protein
MLLAHILGVPVEEFLLPCIGGGVAAGVLKVLASGIDSYRHRVVDRKPDSK